ncbi:MULTISPECIES: zincin-like metallopeptidase domain-containing protein [Thalassospira]|uniref:ArdC family protein n=1 Tax=Thalassospira TaxID=168934 RepID=UPI0008DE91FB|nr:MULTISPECIES: zincin-like metallopeptidase domain-containing protein [Thalassospira]MCD1594449.1 ssDNA-binding domain-containing protein [Thalassospira xiamenensis]MDM7978169.1 zincin-like metallopeptidase domain-containing protein [Thalassospira xiamenensis]OHY99013.1 antirepressor [Thalassospira sp. MIT1004]
MTAYNRKTGKHTRSNLYQDITDKIIAQLEQGTFPWVQPWGRPSACASLGLPQNAATERTYSGINVLILWGAVFEAGYSSQSWLTFRQALKLGGTVRKGERGVTVVYASRFIPGEGKKKGQFAPDTSKDPRAIPFLKRFTVFNLDQCDGLPEDITAQSVPPDTSLIEPKAEDLIRASGIDFRIGGRRAFYSPEDDYVRVPPPQAYFEPINWHRTALHECSHATGHETRLNRDQSGSFGSKKYAFEELVAEMSAAFLCASLGIVPTVRHADYLASWLQVLREDNRAIVRAASQASKSADYLLAKLDTVTEAGSKEVASCV